MRAVLAAIMQARSKNARHLGRCRAFVHLVLAVAMLCSSMPSAWALRAGGTRANPSNDAEERIEQELRQLANAAGVPVAPAVPIAPVPTPPLPDRVTAEGLSRAKTMVEALNIGEPQIEAFLLDQIMLLDPESLEFVDEADEARLQQEEVAAGVLWRTRDGNYYARSHPQDTARSEERTFVATRNASDRGLFNNWRPTDELIPAVKVKMAGTVKGKKLYVVPYIAGPVDSSNRQVGIQVTDNRYAALNLIQLYKVGRVALEAAKERVAQGQTFDRIIHSTGDLDAIKRGGADDERYFVAVPDEGVAYLFGSAYGGNALGPKKFGSLRLSMYRARQEGSWLAEHMLIIGIRNKKTGETIYGTGAFPSASGKTNLAMIEVPDEFKEEYETFIVSDDLAHLHTGSDGRLRAINPEWGFFGVVPMTNSNTNPNAMRAMGENSGALFTNVAAKFVRDAQGELIVEQMWWEGRTDEAPYTEAGAERARLDRGEMTTEEGWRDWTGTPIRDRSPEDRNKPWAHPNSRVTTRITNAPTWIGHVASRPEAERPADWDHPEGVPISFMLFGGRHTFEPFVRQLPDLASGVADGLLMGAFTTAAKEGAPEFRPDPFAQRPFFSYDEASYAAHQFRVLSSLPHPPTVFHVNWFRKDADGQFLLPGYSRNFSVLEWIIRRVKQDPTAVAVNTPIGAVPTVESLKLEALESVGVSRERVEQALSYDAAQWTGEFERREQWLAQPGFHTDRLPSIIREAHARQLAAHQALLAGDITMAAAGEAAIPQWRLDPRLELTSKTEDEPRGMARPGGRESLSTGPLLKALEVFLRRRRGPVNVAALARALKMRTTAAERLADALYKGGILIHRGGYGGLTAFEVSGVARQSAARVRLWLGGEPAPSGGLLAELSEQIRRLTLAPARARLAGLSDAALRAAVDRLLTQWAADNEFEIGAGVLRHDAKRLYLFLANVESEFGIRISSTHWRGLRMLYGNREHLVQLTANLIRLQLDGSAPDAPLPDAEAWEPAPVPRDPEPAPGKGGEIKMAAAQGPVSRGPDSPVWKTGSEGTVLGMAGVAQLVAGAYDRLARITDGPTVQDLIDAHTSDGEAKDALAALWLGVASKEDVTRVLDKKVEALGGVTATRAIDDFESGLYTSGLPLPKRTTPASGGAGGDITMAAAGDAAGPTWRLDPALEITSTAPTRGVSRTQELDGKVASARETRRSR